MLGINPPTLLTDGAIQAPDMPRPSARAAVHPSCPASPAQASRAARCRGSCAVCWPAAIRSMANSF